MGRNTHGLARCIAFSAYRPDDIIAREILRAVEPLAVEAALMAMTLTDQQAAERRRAAELECEQARYEVQLARRRYDAVDPDNRLVASELEARWNAALARLDECEARLRDSSNQPPKGAGDREELLGLATDLDATWRARTSTSRIKQRLVRELIEEIVVDLDDATREVVLVIHWRGEQHSEVRTRKPTSGEHSKRAPVDAHKLILDMAGSHSDEHIAATLNRMGFRTGQGNTWNEDRVESFRMTARIRAYEPASNPREWVTMRDAAKRAGTTHQFLRALIERGVLPAKQVMPDAPWQIRISDLDSDAVRSALARRHSVPRPRSAHRDDRTLAIPGT